MKSLVFLVIQAVVWVLFFALVLRIFRRQLRLVILGKSFRLL